MELWRRGHVFEYNKNHFIGSEIYLKCVFSILRLTARFAQVCIYTPQFVHFIVNSRVCRVWNTPILNRLWFGPAKNTSRTAYDRSRDAHSHLLTSKQVDSRGRRTFNNRAAPAGGRACRYISRFGRRSEAERGRWSTKKRGHFPFGAAPPATLLWTGRRTAWS